jgi:hypothetical protein
VIDVVSSSFYIKAPDFNKADFEMYSSELFDEWERNVEGIINLSDYSLSLVVEEGSIKGRGKVAATLAVLYFGIGKYGDFVSGLKTMQEQAAYVTNALFSEAKSAFQCDGAAGHARRNLDALSYLRNLFNRVQRGELTVDQAISGVRIRFGEETDSVPGFLRELKSGLSLVPRDPHQLTLADQSWQECDEDSGTTKDREPKLPSPSPSPISHHYRIEIYRESKRDTKKMTITKIS